MKRHFSIALILSVLGCLLAPVFSYAYNSTGGSFEVSGPDNQKAVLINAVETTGPNNHPIREHTYEYTINPHVRVTGTGGSVSAPKYLNGYMQFTINTTIPSVGNTVNSAHQDYQVLWGGDTDSLRLVSYQTTGLGSIILCYYFINYPVSYNNEDIPCPSIVVTDTFHFIQGGFSHAEYFDVNVNVSNVQDGCAKLVSPDVNRGLADIVKSSVLNAIDNSYVADIFILLNSIYNMESSIYQQVITYLSGLSTTNTNIYTLLDLYIPYMYNKLESIRVDQLNLHADLLTQLQLIRSSLTDVLNSIDSNNVAELEKIHGLLYYWRSDSLSYYESVLSYLESLAIGSTNTDAQSALAEAESGLAGIASGLEVNKPDADAILSLGDNIFSPEAISAQGLIFAWIDSTTVTSMLVIVVFVGILSYVLYGKL